MALLPPEEDGGFLRALPLARKRLPERQSRSWLPKRPAPSLRGVDRGKQRQSTGTPSLRGTARKTPTRQSARTPTLGERTDGPRRRNLPPPVTATRGSKAQPGNPPLLRHCEEAAKRLTRQSRAGGRRATSTTRGESWLHLRWASQRSSRAVPPQDRSWCVARRVILVTREEECPPSIDGAWWPSGRVSASRPPTESAPSVLAFQFSSYRNPRLGGDNPDLR